MIYTLTTNPAVDLNITSDTMSAHRVNRAHHAVYTPNGKGLNVSFTLKYYGIDSTILGFFGGFSGSYIVDAASQICSIQPVLINGTTRINVFITTPQAEYKFPSDGAPVSEEKQNEMLALLNHADDLNYLVISGSLPPGIDPHYYDRLIDVVKNKNAHVILDISHPYLASLLKYNPLLIKPNDEELATVFGLEATSQKEVLAALKHLHTCGAQNVLLTLGDAGAYFSNGANVWYASAARVNVRSSACAGDATLAGFLSLWLSDQNLVEKALYRAMATGGNVCMNAGLGDFALVDRLAKTIAIRQIIPESTELCRSSSVE